MGYRFDGPDIYLSEEQIVPLSLMLNELLTNSYKYAFEGITGPRIILECRESDHEISLSYRDNGNTSHADEDIREGLGSLIINGLASQLSATISKNFEKGFHFILTFPKAV
jgi:two-component system, sensor histidine kinase PdtaS